MTTTDPPVVLVADDREVAGRYETWLADDYAVRRADSGESTLAELDAAVDVVLVGRSLSIDAGDDLLPAIRERATAAQVALVSSVDLGFEILELGYDDYLVRPDGREALLEAVDRLVERRTADDRVQKYRALVAKRAALESSLSAGVLADSEAFARLTDRIDDLEADLAADTDRLADDAEFVAAIRDLTEEGAPPDRDVDVEEALVDPDPDHELEGADAVVDPDAKQDGADRDDAGGDDT